MEPVLQKWTHFLEEVDYRGVDFKEFQPFVKNVGEELENLYLQYNPETDPK
jgi:hypothetical protein